MASNYPAVMAALRSRVQANVVQLWTGRPLKVAWPNVQFSPPGEEDAHVANVNYEQIGRAHV